MTLVCLQTDNDAVIALTGAATLGKLEQAELLADCVSRSGT
jgi:hypothetical protein